MLRTAVSQRVCQIQLPGAGTLEVLVPILPQFRRRGPLGWGKCQCNDQKAFSPSPGGVGVGAGSLEGSISLLLVKSLRLPPRRRFTTP